MRGESLTKLGAAFDRWRAAKTHRREPAPRELMQQARAAVGVHGLTTVCRVTKLDRRQLAAGAVDGTELDVESPPAFTRLQLSGPVLSTQPFAEVETRAGVKVRLFVQTAEALRLLGSVLGAAGERL